MRVAFFWMAAALALAGAPALAQDLTPRHGLSAFGDLDYPADFKHFRYVNPNAPKGGRIVTRPQKGPQTFDNFNPYIVRGDAADGSEFLYDSLMARAYDHPDALYGLVAESVEMPEDRAYAIFNLRPEARFSDGAPLTADDVAFSITSIRDTGAPVYAAGLQVVKEITVLGPHRIRFDFDTTRPTRDAAAFVAEMPIFSRSYFETRDFTDPDRGQAPLGSGPYRVAEFRNGVFVEYERRDDYWARDLPVMVGQHNFDRIRFRYFVDASLALETFSAGEIDFQEEFFSLNWATKYTFPAVTRGLVILDTLPDGRASGAQGFWINTRREKFTDPRVREAIGLAFDFEWSNEKLFYGLYQRTNSFFEGAADLEASGPMAAAEAALLAPFRDQFSESFFADPAVEPPVSDGSGADRRLLRRAQRLLDEAGWPVKDGVRRNAAGVALEVEFLEIANANFRRILDPFVANLSTIGVAARVRSVDAAQYEQRVTDFDFDLTVRRFALGDTPGAALKGFLSSESAARPGSFNMAGVSHPAIDALIDAVVSARNRAELSTAARALDRVFRAGHYWVPNWAKNSHTVAYWDKFGRPQDIGIAKPAYDRGVLRTWWYDAARADALAARR